MARLTTITTGSGDDGSTGLADGSRITKDSNLIDALGDIDELNAVLGLLICEITDASLGELLQDVQQQLFNIGGELALPGAVLLRKDAVKDMEAQITDYNADLPPLQEFILPGGSEDTARAHHARTVARRAERQLLRASRHHEINPQAQVYLNRLSDLLFVLARVLGRTKQQTEISWERQ